MTPAEITASTLSFDAVLLGTLVMLLLQVIKGFMPSLDGRHAEAWVLTVSAIVTLLVLWSMDADWRDDKTWLVFIIETLKTTIVARATYRMLFFVAVSGTPASADASVPHAAINDPHADPTQDTGELPTIATYRE